MLPDFELNGKKEFLNVYISKCSAESGRKKGALFITFYDETSGNETYDGGRYLVIDLPENDELILDLIALIILTILVLFLLMRITLILKLK